MEEQKYIKSLENVVNDQQHRVFKVPTAEIDFDSYLPTKWGVEYIQLDDEADELEACILNGECYLIEGDKGLGKTQLVHNICLKHNIPIVPLNCSEGTKIADLIGRPQINEYGSYFQLGALPIAIEVANHFGIAVAYWDEFNGLRHQIQKATNSITDDRKSIVANGKTYKLRSGALLSVIATINPSSYSGVNTLTEDARSRFIGSVWEYPSSADLKKIVDWTHIPLESVIEPMMTLVQNIHSLRVSSDVDYSLSPRDLTQFTRMYRMWVDKGMTKPLERSLRNAVVSKFSDNTQRELIKRQIQDIFGVSV